TSSDTASPNPTSPNGTSAANIDDSGAAPTNEGLVADAQAAREANENAAPDLPAAVSSDERTEPVDGLESVHNVDQPDAPINVLLAESGDEVLERQPFANQQMEERRALPGDLPRHIKDRDLPPLYTPREIALVLPPMEEEKEAVDPVVA